MKHLVLILFAVLTVYFAWQYAPQYPKSIVKEFLGKHLFVVLAIVIFMVAALFMQTVSHSTKVI